MLQLLIAIVLNNLCVDPINRELCVEKTILAALIEPRLNHIIL